MGLGFGFVEVGTVTPMPQEGNPKPRVFKIPEFEHAIIQRLGFNNSGVEIFLNNLKKIKKKTQKPNNRINIGKNKGSAKLYSDYEFLYELMQPFSDYITINISSPNTPGLRDLQKKEKLEGLLKLYLRLKNQLSLNYRPIYQRKLWRIFVKYP